MTSKPYRIFVSSVQKEFEEERRAIKDYIRDDILLKQYFEVFLFEDLPAQDQNPENLYLDEVDKSDIYLGLLGNDYGKPDLYGLSPTEKEFRLATKQRKERLIYVKGKNDALRDKRVQKLIREAGEQLIRKRFEDITELKSKIYGSLIIFLTSRGKITLPEFDSSFDSRASYKDIDESLADVFLTNRAIKLKNEVPKINAEDLLQKTLGVVKKDKKGLHPNNTALLFFCKYPQKYIPQSSIKIARYKGITRLKTLDSREVFGDLYTILEEAELFFKKNTRLAGKVVGFKRIDIPEYPYEAIREAIINGMAHRDYNYRGVNVQIEIFDNRVEVTSPGGLLPGLDIKRLAGVHKTRNREICKVFHHTQDMEEFGGGLSKMEVSMMKLGLKPPVLSEEGDFFRVTFYGPGEDILDLASNIPEELQIDLRKTGLNKRQIEALKLMINEERVFTNKEYRELFRVGNKTAADDLKILVRKRFVISRGRGRSVSYIAT